jgi:hypothetical protein
VDGNYDHHVPSSGDDSAYLANIILQAFENGLSLYNNAVDDGTINLGDTYQNISATAAGNVYTYIFGVNPPNYYEDTQTGLKLGGQLLIDSNPAGDDGGLIITFPDATSIDLFVDVEIDYDAETIGPNNFATATWRLGVDSVLADVISVFF